MVGIGHEKPQITVTLAVAGDGSVVEPTQLIFGGKTNQSLPEKGRMVPPPGQYFEKTESHWQTPATFVTYIIKVLAPYRIDRIRELGLEAEQKMILLLDLSTLLTQRSSRSRFVASKQYHSDLHTGWVH